jgi:transposase
MVEGAVDGSIFSNFVYHTAMQLRTNPANAGKRIVLFLDNAKIHRTSEIIDVAKNVGVDLLFSAPYSPFLQPIEQLFNNLKRQLRKLKSQFEK